MIPDQALSQTTPGERVRVIRVSDRSPEVLRHLEGLHVTVGTDLRVEEVNEAADAIRVTVGEDAVHLSWSTATAIRVAPDS